MKAFLINNFDRIPRILLTTLVVSTLFVGTVWAQPGPNDPPQIEIPIVLKSGTSVFDGLVVGLDVRATDGADDVPGLGEWTEETPPFAPSVDGRFIYPGSANQTFADFRFGDGADVSVTHFLEFKKEDGDLVNTLSIEWDLPGFVTGKIEDQVTGTIVNADMAGAGSVEVPLTGQGTLQVTLVQITLDYKNIPPELLPVEMKSFEAVVEGQSAVLVWETANELNNAGFEVQHLINGNFETIGFVEGSGTTLEGAAYQYEVSNLASGEHTFRLKQVDFDGAFEYTDTVSVTIALTTSFVFSQPYPNPFNPQTQFTVAVSRAQDVELSVYNLLGERVATLFRGELEANNAHLFTFEAGNLPSGRYFVRAQGSYFSSVRSITLLK